MHTGPGLYVVGAGGAGREALDICVALGREIIAFLDDSADGQIVRRHEVRKPDDAVCGAEYVVAIASAAARIRLSRLLDARGLRPTSLIHPRAVVCPETTIGPGAIVQANVMVSSSVTIGSHCQLHYNATVGHDTTLADYVTVLPGANVAGNVYLAEGAVLGSGAVVLQGRTVDVGAVVGAGAVVTRDVPGEAIVVGSPAAPLRSRVD
jgi:sugar O-acyltransferase (sialic acid O-acetyltransferase NeuD family)